MKIDFVGESCHSKPIVYQQTNNSHIIIQVTLPSLQNLYFLKNSKFPSLLSSDNLFQKNQYFNHKQNSQNQTNILYQFFTSGRLPWSSTIESRLNQQGLNVIVYSMDRRSKRQLRHNASCTPFPNIFKNQNYILNSGCQFLPEDIYHKVNRFQTITCDEINSLTFVRNQPHEHILHRMNEAFSAQNKMINNNLNFQSRNSMWRQERESIDNDLRQFRIIKSEEQERFGCEEEILKLPCFKNDLENLFIS